MSEAIFPLLGSLVVFGLVLPASAVIVKLVFVALRRVETAGGLHASSGLRYVLLVASSAVPLAWFLSASLQQLGTGAAAEVCDALHTPGAFCPESLLFAVALSLLIALRGVPRLASTRRSGGDDRTDLAREARRRIDRAIVSASMLGPLAGRIIVREDAAEPMATLGIVLPRVIVRPSLVARLDDEELTAALLHEGEHVRGYDPVRYLVAWWALAVNPVGHWVLGDELSRWILLRETHCDREAVLHGGSPAALAQALVRAARASVRPAAGLCTGPPTALELRVGLLLAYAERAPERCCRSPALRLAMLAVGAALLLPHGTGTRVLDILHWATERAFPWR